MTLRLAFMGSPDFAVPSFKALIDAGHEIACVYSQPPRPAGRGRNDRKTPVHEFAQARGLTVRTPKSLKGPKAQAAFAALKLDLAVVVAYGLILPQAVLDLPRHGCINVHASLLPRWRGAAPIHRAILAGDAKTGVAIMQMEAGLDTGPVLLETFTAIGPRETTGELHDRLATLGAEAIVHVLSRLSLGEEPGAAAQSAHGITYANKVSPEEAQIDWSTSAVEIDRKVRAFNPSPGAWTTWRGEKLKIWATALVPVPACLGSSPGTVTAAEGEHLLVSCGSSIVAVTEIQRAGGKRMTVGAWLRGGGHPAVGETLGS